jgi:hypothetical protein
LSQKNKPKKEGVRLKLFLQNEIAATEQAPVDDGETLPSIFSRWPVFVVFMEQFIRITGKTTHDSS